METNEKNFGGSEKDKNANSRKVCPYIIFWHGRKYGRTLVLVKLKRGEKIGTEKGEKARGLKSVREAKVECFLSSIESN